jgi:RNA polymerase-binding protein DksA
LPDIHHLAGPDASLCVASETALRRGVFDRSGFRRWLMEKGFTEKMKELLLSQKREILETLIATNADFRAIVEEMDPKDFADVASDDIDRKMIEALGTQDIKRLRAIDAALGRINQGRYGLCMKCNKKIPSERLQAIPYAVLCVECQKGEERRNR